MYIMSHRGLGRFIILYLISSSVMSCAVLTDKNPRPVIPIALFIEHDEPQLNALNTDVYAYRVLDVLEDFNIVNLDLVDDPDSAQIHLSISIDRYSSFPPEQSVSRRVFRRAIQAGTNASGQPVYQTVTASADIVQSRIRTSALFNTNLVIKGKPGKTFKRSFSENLNIDRIYAANIQGDTRALDPSIIAATMPPMEPREEDIIMALSNKEMLGRLSREIRAYYQK